MLKFVVLAAGDWWSFLIPIVFFVIYALNHLISASKPTPPPRAKQQRRPPAPPERPTSPQQKPVSQPGQPPAPQPAGQQSTLNSEIEQFLKRANERRGDRTRREPMVKSPPKAPPRAPAPPVRVEPSERPGFDSVAASVEKHMANRGFTQRAEHLADDIVRADQEMEQHLQKSFSRRIGTLGPTTPSPTGPVTDAEPVADQPQPAASAMMLGGVLASGQQLKQAFVLNEILQRPEHRW